MPGGGLPGTIRAVSRLPLAFMAIATIICVVLCYSEVHKEEQINSSETPSAHASVVTS
jgi:hypothetical protein